MADQLEGEPIDVLVHVAGVGALDHWGSFDFDAMLDHYSLNALGPLRVVAALAEILPLPVNDNLTVPLSAGAAMTLLGS